MNLKQLILSPTCLQCHSWLCTESLFCGRCYTIQILNRLNETCLYSESEGRKHVYLFDWNRGESETLNKLVYRLKSNNSTDALHFYSHFLAEKITTQLDCKKLIAVVPVPSSKSASVHAHLIAAYLSDALRRPMWSIFQKQVQQQQKYLSAIERKQSVRFTLDESLYEEFTRLDGQTPVDSKSQDRWILFVDDVLTTGQSFLQCEKLLRKHNNALGIPIKQIVIATLFYRPPLGAPVGVPSCC